MDAFRTKFLLTALPDVPFDGWTDGLMERTAEKLGESFPYGVKGLVAYFSAWATAETLKKLEKTDMKSLRVREKIAFGVRTRLEILAPYKRAVSAALPFLPLKKVWEAADKIWWAAGDTATDYNHYTKRILLSGVLTSTTLYWLNDTSKDHRATWEFLERRIDNVLFVGGKLARFKKKKEG